MAERTLRFLTGLLIWVVLQISFAPTVRGCITLNQPCGPMYWCCDCDPRTNLQLTCSLAIRDGTLKYVCATYAFEPHCNQVSVQDAFGLPRKLGFSSSNGLESDQELDETVVVHDQEMKNEELVLETVVGVKMV